MMWWTRKQRGRIGLGLVIGWSAFALALAGCQGAVDSPFDPVDGPGPGTGPDGTPTTPTRPVVGSCDPSVDPPGVAWLRLSRTQVARTVESLVGDSVDGLDRLLSAVPIDITAYPSVASPLSPEHLQAYGNIAAAVGDLVVLEPTVRDRYVTCDLATMDDACARDFVRAFSETAERRALADAQLDARVAILRTEDQPEDGVRLVVRSVLQSPRFLYLIEQGDPASDEGTSWALTSREAANRIAYGFLGEPPDAALISQATALDSDSNRRSAVQTLMSDPRVRAHFGEFIRTWLGIDEAVPPTFSDAFLNGLDLSPSGGADSFEKVAVDEVLAVAEYIAFDQNGTLTELLTTRLGLPSDPRLAGVYGVSSSDSWVELPEERAGLFTRVGALYSGLDNENPVLRGVHIRRHILCDQLPPPPPDTASMTPDELPARGDVSTREWFDLLTQAPNCMGCHVAINSLGHAFGAFDGLGRFASEDNVYETGQLVGTHPVDVAVVPNISSQSEPVVTGGAGLSAAIAADPRSHECFAAQLFHFTMGRSAEEGDGCVVAAMTDALANGTIVDAWLALAAHEDFNKRTAGVER